MICGVLTIYSPLEHDVSILNLNYAVIYLKHSIYFKCYLYLSWYLILRDIANLYISICYFIYFIMKSISEKLIPIFV